MGILKDKIISDVVEQQMITHVFKNLRTHEWFASLLNFKRIANMMEESKNKTTLLNSFDEFMYELCAMSGNHYLKEKQIGIEEDKKQSIFKDILKKFEDPNKPYHTPQAYTQKLLDLGVLVFSETTADRNYIEGDSECYNVSSNYILGVKTKCSPCGISIICMYSEVYDDDDKFVCIFCDFYDEHDDEEVLPKDMIIFKKMEID